MFLFLFYLDLQFTCIKTPQKKQQDAERKLTFQSKEMFVVFNEKICHQYFFKNHKSLVCRFKSEFQFQAVRTPRKLFHLSSRLSLVKVLAPFC